MTLGENIRHKVGVRELIDGLRDNFIVSLPHDTALNMDNLLAAYDRAVSETILDLLDQPTTAPPSRQRRVRSDAGRPRAPRVDPPIARLPRTRRRKGIQSPAPEVAHIIEDLGAKEDAGKQPVDDVKGVAAGV